ncbi:hypothetical protein NE236_19205, partial [Actinoallomurus purpureus]|uniref:hypothetical protein n=1 Tax=Actinoallomurus purpureus TaxID=478114 RepID=UPI0020923810
MRAVAALAAAGIAAGALVSTATGASAASNPCGAGYTLRHKVDIKKPLYGKEGYKPRTVGQVWWYQKDPRHSAPRVCAITKPLDTLVGKTTWLDVYLIGKDSSDRDSGNFKYYAGPVYVARTG